MPSVDSAVTTLYLIRHGATACNEARPVILQGCGLNGPLSELGERQAQSVASLLAARPISAIYSSFMLRARQTAAAIAEHHPFEPQVVEGLQEINVGDWEGHTWPQIEADYPDDFERFMADPINTPYRGGESYQNVLERVLPIVRELLSRHRGESIAVVAHNVVNRMLLTYALGVTPIEARRMAQENCTVNILTDGTEGLRVQTLNSCLHLPLPTAIGEAVTTNW